MWFGCLDNDWWWYIDTYILVVQLVYLLCILWQRCALACFIMTVTLLGPRASTPKTNVSRNLRKLPHNYNDTHIPRPGRLLPVPPSRPPEVQSGVGHTRALPRVPRPMAASVNSISVNILGSADTPGGHPGRDVNPAAVPTIPRHPRQLPKLPTGGKAQDRKRLDTYREEGDKCMSEAEYEKAHECYTCVSIILSQLVFHAADSCLCFRIRQKTQTGMNTNVERAYWMNLKTLQA